MPHPLRDVLVRQIETDIQQMKEEGHDEAALKAELAAAQAAGGMDPLARLQENLASRPSPAGFPYVEPNDWDSIAATFPDAESHARFAGSKADLADRLLAAWQGRATGCQLGKPLEGTTWPDKIRTVLETVGSWPLDDYMNPPSADAKAEELPDCDFFQRGMDWRRTLCKGMFDCVAPDDDILYAQISQLLLEKHGPDFTSDQAVPMLQQHAYDSCLYASGRHMFRSTLYGIPASVSARYGNPCRQSLGAMIRCDPFGWGAPGNPALAARMAYRDAVNTQTRNGIYAGIFFATLLADTLATGDPVASIATATAYVPPRSRFAEMIRLVQGWCDEAKDWQKVDQAILERWPEEARRFNHAITNAAIVIAGLLLGGGDFARTICSTVMCGLDTDCTGATAGSIMGCALGTGGIPAKWTAPFRDTVRSEVKGQCDITLTELGKRMFEVAVRNARLA